MSESGSGVLLVEFSDSSIGLEPVGKSVLEFGIGGIGLTMVNSPLQEPDISLKSGSGGQDSGESEEISMTSALAIADPKTQIAIL